MKKKESHNEADLTKMTITKLMSRKKIKDVPKMNMKMKVIVAKMKCKDGENIKRNEVHEKQELAWKNIDIYSEDDIDSSTDFDMYYLDRDKNSDAEDDPKCDEYLDYEDAAILRRNIPTYNYEMSSDKKEKMIIKM